MNTFMCRKCSNTTVFMQQKGMQLGLYCASCGSWIKWVGKKEFPILKSRGIPFYSEGMTVKLSNENNNLGFEDIGLNPVVIKRNKELAEKTSFEEFGIEFNKEEEKKNLENSENFGKMPKNYDIEAEVERRVAIKLQEIKNKEKVTNNSDDDNVNSEYCPICEGGTLISDGNSKVEVMIYSGVLTVTDKDGVNILGLYKLKRCPNCGKIF